MELAPKTIMAPQTAGWKTIGILYDYLTAVDISKFDTTHNLASKMRGVAREFIITGVNIPKLDTTQ